VGASTRLVLPLLSLVSVLLSRGARSIPKRREGEQSHLDI